MKLEFNPEDWEMIFNYLRNWNEWVRSKNIGRPDFTTSAIYLVPFTIALIKSQENIEKLTWVLIILTAILVITALIQIVQYLSG